MPYASKREAIMPFLHTENNSQKSSCVLNFDSKGRLDLGKHLQNQYLTAREVDILKCLLKGCSAKETGLELGISYRTVESYMSSLKLKLCCTKKSELIGFCLKLGLFKLFSDEEL